jgi:hypothetical protein
MSRLQRFASLVLVALWLPTTLHCELETSGLFEALTECVAAGDDCCDDTNCSTLEDALYKESALGLKVPAPDATPCLVCLAVAFTPDSFFAELVLAAARHEPPPELGVAWQFLTRAAPPARAPALNT